MKNHLVRTYDQVKRCSQVSEYVGWNFERCYKQQKKIVMMMMIYLKSKILIQLKVKLIVFSLREKKRVCKPKNFKYSCKR